MREVLAQYPNATEVVWLQEEPDNMGPWHFVEARFWKVKQQGYDLRLVSRIGSGSPATGRKAIHDRPVFVENGLCHLVNRALAGSVAE